jgi:hypothetical protein
MATPEPCCECACAFEAWLPTISCMATVLTTRARVRCHVDGRIGVKLDHDGHEIKVRASNLVPIAPLPDAFEAAAANEIRKAKALDFEKQVDAGSPGAKWKWCKGFACPSSDRIPSHRCAATRAAGRQKRTRHAPTGAGTQSPRTNAVLASLKSGRGRRSTGAIPASFSDARRMKRRTGTKVRCAGRPRLRAVHSAHSSYTTRTTLIVWLSAELASVTAALGTLHTTVGSV